MLPRFEIKKSSSKMPSETVILSWYRNETTTNSKQCCHNREWPWLQLPMGSTRTVDEGTCKWQLRLGARQIQPKQHITGASAISKKPQLLVNRFNIKKSIYDRDMCIKSGEHGTQVRSCSTISPDIAKKVNEKKYDNKTSTTCLLLLAMKCGDCKNDIK